MKYRELGSTGLSVSEIGIGAWQLGGPLLLDGKVDGHPEIGKDEAINLIRQIGDMGVNFIDTAEQYGKGESERRVGEALAGHRDKWVISTKFGHKVGPNNERIKDTRPEIIMESIEGSLKRLNTDYIDVYLYHTTPVFDRLDEAKAILAQAKEQGKIRHFGISTENVDFVKKLQEESMLDVVQFVNSILNPATETREIIRNNKLGGIVRGTFAGGRLTGRYFEQGFTAHKDDIRSNFPDDYTKYSVYQECIPGGMNMVQLAIRYLLDQVDTTNTIILGAKSASDYDNAIKAVECAPLTAENRARIDELTASLK